MKGIIYIMTTAVSGLIKIGQTGIGNYMLAAHTKEPLIGNIKVKD